MKISEDHARWSLGTPWRNLTFLKVRDRRRLIGVAEARMLSRTDALLGYLEEIEKQLHPRQRPVRHRAAGPADVRRRLRAASGEIVGARHRAASRWPAGTSSGKALDQPVYRLLGGAVRDRIKAYANGWYTVERTPEEFHAAAKRAVAKGYRALKFDPFGAGLLRDGPRREATVRSRWSRRCATRSGPDVEILIEMHGRFSPATAIDMAHDLRAVRARPGSRSRCRRTTSRRCMAKAVAQDQPPDRHRRAASTRARDCRELFELRRADILQRDITHVVRAS